MPPPTPPSPSRSPLASTRTLPATTAAASLLRVAGALRDLLTARVAARHHADAGRRWRWRRRAERLRRPARGRAAALWRRWSGAAAVGLAPRPSCCSSRGRGGGGGGGGSSARPRRGRGAAAAEAEASSRSPLHPAGAARCRPPRAPALDPLGRAVAEPDAARRRRRGGARSRGRSGWRRRSSAARSSAGRGAAARPLERGARAAGRELRGGAGAPRWQGAAGLLRLPTALLPPVVTCVDLALEEALEPAVRRVRPRRSAPRGGRGERGGGRRRRRRAGGTGGGGGVGALPGRRDDGAAAAGLRVLGVDSLLREEAESAGALFRRAERDGRILLTRDRKLPARRDCKIAVFVVASDEPKEQLREVVHRFGIRLDASEFMMRCAVCNGRGYHPLTREEVEVARRLPAKGARRRHRVLRVPLVRQVYWEGPKLWPVRSVREHLRVVRCEGLGRRRQPLAA